MRDCIIFGFCITCWALRKTEEGEPTSTKPSSGHWDAHLHHRRVLHHAARLAHHVWVVHHRRQVGLAPSAALAQPHAVAAGRAAVRCTEALLRSAQVLPRRRVVRVQLQRAPVRVHRVREPLRVEVRVAEAGVRLGVGGICADGYGGKRGAGADVSGGVKARVLVPCRSAPLLIASLHASMASSWRRR